MKYNIMQHSKIKTNKVWQKQDHKHQISQCLQSLRLHNNPQSKYNNRHIKIGHILSQNFQENQKKVQKLIYLELMIGRTYINFRKVSRFKDAV